MDEKTEKTLAHSLTAEDTGIIPHLPYLLQDLWLLGGSPTVMANLLRQNLPRTGGLRVLDLACGKGAVAVHLAKELGCEVKGVDILREFTAEARKKAGEYGVAHMCQFKVRDANETVKTERDWDCVVYTASGDVLGTPEEMLQKLRDVVSPGGYILFGESYLPEDMTADELEYSHGYIPYSRWQALFAQYGLEEIARVIDDGVAIESQNESDMAYIQRRAQELAEQYPDKAGLFEGYVKSQLAEVDDLEQRLINADFLLRRKEE